MKKENNKKENRGKILKGTVISNKMKNTVVVLVERYVKHLKFKKYFKKSKKYKVHDFGNKCNIGDKVVIEETRPISKDKNFKIVEILPKNLSSEIGE